MPAAPRLRVAVAQVAERSSHTTDAEQLLQLRLCAARARQQRGVELLVFPEMYLSGYSCAPELVRAGCA